MSTVLDLSLKEIALKSLNKKIVVQNIDWNLFNRISTIYNDCDFLRLSFNDNFVEIDAANKYWEKPFALLSDLVKFTCEETKTDYIEVGQTVLRDINKAKSVQTLGGFYIQNKLRLKDLLKNDSTTVVSPDLVIEVDVTSPSLDKMPIYAALGVPEVWLYKGERVEFYQLFRENYQKIENSIALPVLSSAAANQFLQKGLIQSSSVWIKSIREWANENK